MKRHSVKSDILSGAIADGRPQTFLIRPYRASNGRTRCRCLGSGRPSTTDLGSWKLTRPLSWPTVLAASWLQAFVFQTSAAAAWNGSSGRCWLCASTPCCTPRSMSAAGGPSSKQASRSPNAICRPNSAPTLLFSALDLYLKPT